MYRFGERGSCANVTHPHVLINKIHISLESPLPLPLPLLSPVLFPPVHFPSRRKDRAHLDLRAFEEEWPLTCK